jgi:hypothetical protein
MSRKRDESKNEKNKDDKQREEDSAARAKRADLRSLSKDLDPSIKREQASVRRSIPVKDLCKERDNHLCVVMQMQGTDVCNIYP